MSLLERIYSYRKYIDQDWEVPNYPLNFVALIKRLFPFYVHGCKYMQRSTGILHYGRKIRALFHQNTCSTIFIPSFLRIYVVEKGRRIENYFSVACLGAWVSLSLSHGVVVSLFLVSVFSGHILTSWEDILWDYLFVVCVLFSEL